MEYKKHKQLLGGNMAFYWHPSFSAFRQGVPLMNSPVEFGKSTDEAL